MCADNMYPHNQQSDPHTLVSDSQKTQNNIHNFSGNDNQEHQSSLLGKSSEINENAYNSLSHTQPTGEASTGSLSSTKNNANALLSNLSSKQPAPILTPAISMNGLVTSLPSTVENSDGDKINQSQTMIPQQLPMPSHQPIIPYQQQPHQAYVGNLQQQKLLQNDINSSLINNSGDNSRITASNINTDTTQINNSTALTSSTSAVPTIKMTMPTTKGKYSLNDFHLVQTLGTGSFGRVHLVCSVHNGRYYAMKVFRKSHVVKAKQIEHTNDERRILSMCRHPFITRMWGTFQDCKSIFIIMDYIEGGELFSLLRKSKVFPNQVAKFYAAEVLLALQYLHLKNIIYRDLKPENILISRSGHIKLADFGFAKQVETTTYTLCGTPDYIAPEIIAVQPYTKAVDYWSFGILIYEMIAGTTPFYDPSPMKTYENITKCEVVYPNHFQMDVINLLQGLITKDVTYRLGNLKNGIEDIKNHPWFDEVIWQNLLQGNIETPYEPNIPPGVGDTSQFEKYPEDRYDYGITGVPDEYGYLFPEF